MNERSEGAEVINLAEEKLKRAKTQDKMSKVLEELRKQDPNKGKEAFGREYFISLRQKIIARQVKGELSVEEAKELFRQIEELKKEVFEERSF